MFWCTVREPAEALLFTIYYIELHRVFQPLQFHYHMHADDSQLHVEFPHISQFIADVKSRMASHDLLLNESKNVVVVISAVHNHKHVQPRVDLTTDVRATSCRNHVPGTSVLLLTTRWQWLGILFNLF